MYSPIYVLKGNARCAQHQAIRHYTRYVPAAMAKKISQE